MHKFCRFSIVAAVFASVGFFLHAQETQNERSRGKVLLLKTGHAMEGDIEKVGAQLCVRRGKSEVWIAQEKALRLCADWDDAFAFARTQIKADDANDRVRLARWCHLHRLTERALQEARIALELQPSNSEAKQIVLLLERALKDPPARPAAPPPVAVARPIEPTPSVDVSFETQVGFTAKVQPILMNKCALCHASGASGKFRLERVSDGGQKSSTQRNLAAVLNYIDVERPAISPLLVKAVTPHGDAQAAPLRDRSTLPLQAMQRWIEETVAKNPQLQDYHARKHPPSKRSSEPKSVFPSRRSASPMPGEAIVSQQAPRLEIDEKNPPRPALAPMSLTPADEFDPVIYNSWAHPQARK